MRMMMRISIPSGAGNDAIRDGQVPSSIQAFMQNAKPEAAYFTAMGGRRCMIAVFDMASSSEIPRLAEPFFQELQADIEFMPCMNGADLAQGLAG